MNAIIALVGLLLIPQMSYSMKGERVLDPVICFNEKIKTVLPISKDSLLVGGEFSRMDRCGKSQGAILDSERGTRIRSFSIDGEARAVVSDGSGGWYVGGKFTNVDGQDRANLVHILADGKTDPVFVAKIPDQVSSLILIGKNLVVGTSGQFDMGGSVLLIDAKSGGTPKWKHDSSWPVRSLAVDGGSIFATGKFKLENNASESNKPTFATGIGVIDSSTGAIQALKSDVDLSKQMSESIRAIATANGRLYIGGTLENLDSDLIVIDLKSGKKKPAPLIRETGHYGGTVSTILAAGTSIYIAGGFKMVDGKPRSGIAELDSSTSELKPWSAQLSEKMKYVLSIAADDKSLFVGYWGGQFGLTILESFDRKSGALGDWKPVPRGSVYVLCSDKKNVFTGGKFDFIGGQPARALVNLNPSKAFQASWQADIEGSVNSLARKDGTVYVGGLFSKVAQLKRGNLAAIDLVSGKPTTWDPKPNRAIRAILPINDKVFIAGDFTETGKIPRGGIAALFAKTGEATAWQLKIPAKKSEIMEVMGGQGIDQEFIMERQITGLASNKASVFIAGNFAEVEGQQRAGLTSFSLSTGKLTHWNPRREGEFSEPQLIQSADDVIYVSGKNIQSYFLKALDSKTGRLKNWKPSLPLIQRSDALQAMAIGNDLAFLGFLNPEGPSLLVFDRATGAPRKDWSSVDQQLKDKGVSSLSIFDSKLFIGIVESSEVGALAVQEL